MEEVLFCYIQKTPELQRWQIFVLQYFTQVTFLRNARAILHLEARVPKRGTFPRSEYVWCRRRGSCLRAVDDCGRNGVALIRVVLHFRDGVDNQGFADHRREIVPNQRLVFTSVQDERQFSGA